MLADLEAFLGKMEEKEELVWVIGHGDPADCNYIWLKEFNKIMKKYESTVLIETYGNTKQISAKDNSYTFLEIDKENGKHVKSQTYF